MHGWCSREVRSRCIIHVRCNFWHNWVSVADRGVFREQLPTGRVSDIGAKGGGGQVPAFGIFDQLARDPTRTK